MNEMKHAIKSNDIATVKSLLADGSVDVNARIAGGLNSPLLVLAADRGHVEIVALLLDEGAHIDAVNGDGDSACHVAVLEGHAAVVELLVARNANVSLRNRSSQMPITIAINNMNERLMMLLIDAAMAAGTPLDDETACRAAAFSADVIRLLLFKHRINLNATRDELGRTPLHQAVRWRRNTIVLDLLIEVAGVDVDTRDESGETAAHVACMFNYAAALARLVAAGANLDLADNHSVTPLHHCQFHLDDEIIVLLLAAGANTNMRNNSGRTPCYTACERSLASLAVLIACGAKLDEPDNKGVTPRQLLKSPPPTAEEVEAARRRVLTVRLSLVRQRAFDVCVGLQSLGLDALCTCEILFHSCGPVAPLIAFHRWWEIATTVKHWQQ